MKERDNLHYNFRTIDGYNKPINIVISAREAAKSTSFNLDKAYFKWKKDGATILYLVRQVVEINEALIESIQDNIINKFTDDNVKFQYSKTAFRDGIVDIKINGKIYMRILALNIPSRRIKQALLKDIGVIVFDEFIINQRLGEKYLPSESTKIAEIYTTYKRERIDNGLPLKIYFLGNPYSLYNPVFMWLGISPSKLKLGEILVGKNYVVQWYKLTEELKAKILADNPLYEFDEDYKAYAFDGKPILDENIKLEPQVPSRFSIRFLFRIEHKIIAVYNNNYWEDGADLYYCKFISPEDASKRRTMYCFDFGDLVNRSALVSKSDISKFNKFKIAMRKRQVAFQSIDCYYLVEEIYFNL